LPHIPVVVRGQQKPTLAAGKPNTAGTLVHSKAKIMDRLVKTGQKILEEQASPCSEPTLPGPFSNLKMPPDLQIGTIAMFLKGMARVAGP
jgi:hypothetical protein